MRKATLLVMLITVLAWAGAFDVDLAEAQICSVDCQYRTIRCCTSGTCSTSPGTLNCNGTVANCSTIDVYDACILNCSSNRESCYEGCGGTSEQCIGLCEGLYDLCRYQCGPAPQTYFGC
jgi:hypothetical protein